MKISREDLAARFEQLSDEALLKRHNSGELTADAQAVIQDEIRRRGLSTPPIATDSANPIEPATPGGDLVNIAGYLTLPEAQVMQALLDAESIPAFLADGYMAQSMFAPLGISSGARLMVHENNAIRAMEILRAFKNGDYGLSDDYEPS